MYMKRTYFFNTFKYNFLYVETEVIFLRGSFFFMYNKQKIAPWVIFSSTITNFSSAGGHFSTLKNYPRSLFCGVHNSSLHRSTEVKSACGPKIRNAAVIVFRRLGKHLEPRRFEIMNKLVLSVAT